MKQLPNKFSVYAKTIEEAEYIAQKQKELCGYSVTCLENEYYRFNILNKESGKGSSSYLNTPALKSYNIQHEFTCDEFKEFFEEEFVLPEKWHVIVTKDNLEYFKSLSNYKHLNLGDWSSITSLTTGTDTYLLPNDSKSITLKQFQEHILKQTNTMKEENKKIVGYKLIKPEYIEAVSKIVDFNYSQNQSDNYDHQSDSISQRLKEAGVLDLWFEPVFEDTIKLPDINGYNGKIDGDFVIYGSNCAKFHKDFFLHLNTINDYNTTGNRKIESITLGTTQVKITMDQVKQIVEFLNK